MKIQKILQSLIFIFLLIGILFPVNAFTYQGQDPNLGNIVIDIQSGPKNYFTELFGIITTTPTVVKPGQTLTINVGLEIPRNFDRTSSFLYVNIPAFYEKKISPLPCSAYQSCLVKVTVQNGPTRIGIYTVGFSAADKDGIIDRSSQSFSVSQDSLQCPSSVWGPYVDFVRTSDGNGQIQRSTRNIYDSQCKFVDLASQTFTKCDSGFYITGQATSVTQSSGTKTCTKIPGSNAQPGCGNGIIDTGEYCDINNVGASCNDFGYSGGNLKCKSTCQDFDSSSCTGGTLPPFGTKEAGERCYDNNECKSLLCEGNFLKIIPGFCKDLDDPQQRVLKVCANGAIDYPTCEILSTTVTGTQLSLTYQDWKDSTSATRIKTVCSIPENCLPYEDLTGSGLNYSIQCKSNGAISTTLADDYKKACDSSWIKKISNEVSIFSGLACAGTISLAIVCTTATAGICSVIGAPAAVAICTTAAGIATTTLTGCSLLSQSADSISKGACLAIPKSTSTGNFFDTPLFPIGDFQVTGLYLILGIIGFFLLMSLSRRN